MIDLENPKTRSDLLADCNNKFARCVQARQTFEKQWYLNMSFFFGKQWVEWLGRTGTSDFNRLYEPPAPKWRVRLVINKVRTTVRNELTKLTKEEPQSYVRPNSTEDSDIAAARAAEAVSIFLIDELKLNKVRRQATFWALLCGTSFIKDYWDPFAVDTDGTQGKLCVDPVSAFHLFVPDVQVEEIEPQPYVIHASAKDPDWVESVYNVKVSTDAKVTSSQLEQKFLNSIGIQANADNRYAHVKEMWIKPNVKFPEGAVITWVNEQLLSVVEMWPFEHKEYPFSKIDHVPTGRFYASSVIEDLIPVQKEYNRTRSQLIEAKNKMAKPQLIAAKGSIDPQKLTSEPGLVILYTPGFAPPTHLPLTEIPQYVIEELDRTSRDFDDISGQYETTKGRTPPGVEAASAIAYLQEENDTRLYHTVASIEEAVEKVGQHLLKNVVQYWDATKVVKTTGVNASFEAMSLSGSSLQGNTDFRVMSGSSAPRSLAAKQAFIMELGKNGWIQPDQVMRYLDLVETRKLYEESQVTNRQCQREHFKLRQGVQLQINDWDDDPGHTYEHMNFMRSQEFEILPEEVRALFVQHLQMHMMRMQSSMQMQQQMQQGPAPAQSGAPNQGQLF